MKFLYKIWSGYDGFTPQALDQRLLDGSRLSLGWTRYLEVVEEGDEVWVFFHGRGTPEPGVYVKGVVDSTQASGSLLLRVTERSREAPLTDAAISARAAEIVATRYRQVFLVPEDWFPVLTCSVGASADSCRQHQCSECPTWKSLPRIQSGDLATPRYLTQQRIDFLPAYWVLPSRCYLYHQPGEVKPLVKATSDLFYRFKVGEEALAYPLALGIYERLREAGFLTYNAIVPIPLSPDKAKAKEIHRTRLLSDQLSGLLSVPVIEALQLKVPISKRRLMSWAGYTYPEFKAAYAAALEVKELPRDASAILLVDDVATRGMTLRVAAGALRQAGANSITAVTAGQMALKTVVRKTTQLMDGA